MLFHSLPFLAIFLPLCAIGLSLVGRLGRRWAPGWLVLCSLGFYSWWHPPHLALLLGSLVANFTLGRHLAARRNATGATPRGPLAIGVVANLALLGWFKYAGFLAQNVAALGGPDIALGTIVLPLAISFFTFQQIAYLVDTARGLVQESDPLAYALFVTFFPQLIAGPIVHHSEVMPQVAALDPRRPDPHLRALAVPWFVAGLAKKVLLADRLAAIANPVFDHALKGSPLSWAEAWTGALAYTYQLYFDFSGYSDMAIGLGLFFGLRLPLNFASPYQARTIAEFWRRWHMTLSRFLRDYLYIPLGGNRGGEARRYLNLMLTMLLGGLWHGAGWAFVVWGGLHGLYLCVQRVFTTWADRAWPARRSRGWWQLVATSTTLLAAILAWCFFRAESLAGGWAMIRAMFGGDIAPLPRALGGAGGLFTRGLVTDVTEATALIAFAAIVAATLPNTQQWLGAADPAPSRWVWLARLRAARVPLGPRTLFATGIVFALSVLHLTKVTEFLYFQF